MKVSTCKLDGIFLIEPRIFGDERGFFMESFQIERYKEIGIAENFVQDNYSHSKKNVLRGMHFTKTNPQSQLLTVMQGRIFDVVVDIRKESSTFGEWFGGELSDNGLRQIYMPHGFAHGFFVLSDWADLHYKVSQTYNEKDNFGFIWNDENINIDWPISHQIISEKDKSLPKFLNI